MADDRTRKLSFSSEQSVDRWFGGEILDHSPAAVRTAFLNSGNAPLLWGHDSYSQPIGVIPKGTVAIGKDKVGRASARFAKTAAGADALTNVDDGIISNTSVGYQIYELRLDSEQDGESTYLVTDWEPYEVSLVGLPADRSVGVGRIETDDPLNTGARSMDNDATAADKKAAEDKAAADAAAARKAAADEATRQANEHGTRIEVVRDGEARMSATEMEAARRKAIDQWCARSNIDDRMRAKFITSGMSLDKVADEIIVIMQERGKVASQSAGRLGLTSEETQRFSLCKAILAVRDKDWSKAGFEAECSQAIAKRLGSTPDPMKFYVPDEVQRQQRVLSPAAEQYARQQGLINSAGGQNAHLTRADVVGTTTAGGYLVETINLSFIELLRNRTVAFRLGATVLSGLVGNVTIPKQTGASTAMWLTAETTQITEVEQTFGQLALNPHTVGGYTEISRLLLLQSSPDIEGIVNADLAAIVGIAVDQAILSGPGSAGAPHGIIGLAGVGTAAGTTLALATLLTAQAAVGAANVVPVRGGWASTFVNSALMRARQEFANTYSPLWYGSIWNGVMVGFPALASNQVPTGDCLFGDWAQVVVAEWGVLEIEVNPYANFQAGIIGVRALMTVDVGVRYPGAFYVITAVT